MKIDIYKTKDLAESAALIVSKQHLIQIQRIGKICWFIFENKEECSKISQTYFFGNLLVSARDFHEAMTRLKNRMFAGI